MPKKPANVTPRDPGVIKLSNKAGNSLTADQVKRITGKPKRKGKK